MRLLNHLAKDFLFLLLKIFCFLAFALLSFAQISLSQDVETESQVAEQGERPRDYLWPPLASFFLPGFDQWWEGQYTEAAIYSGVAIGGLSYTSWNLELYEKSNRDFIDNDKEDEETVSNKDNHLRKAMFGTQTYMLMGSLSSYQSFRLAVNTQRPTGKFKFLDPQKEESLDTLLKAPFEFKFLKRSSTYVPLLIAAGLMSLQLAAYDREEFRYSNLGSDDVFFSASTSYFAGTNEEAFFRGYMLPASYQAMGDFFWSNTLTSGVFALAHYPSVQVPVAQFFLAWYFGSVTRSNNWMISEAIFIHTWWDVIIFLGMYQLEKKQSHELAMSTDFTEPRKRAPLWLPPVEFRF
ncbi:MAG: CPBP family intramembrane metalloprotease [Oligoflexales bacterium]|nr:CPBP family intramembrane metalloprotease [Oligoflexales bacterium]